MAKIKYCHYCDDNTTFQVKRCSRCKKLNSHENKNEKWAKVKLKELKLSYNGSLNERIKS